MYCPACVMLSPKKTTRSPPSSSNGSAANPRDANSVPKTSTHPILKTVAALDALIAGRLRRSWQIMPLVLGLARRAVALESGRPRWSSSWRKIGEENRPTLIPRDGLAARSRRRVGPGPCLRGAATPVGESRRSGLQDDRHADQEQDR